jgi:hypothetical protein
MARPSIPETDKKRTVPFRMTKPDYRRLMVLMKIKDRTIQEHLRDALDSYLDEELDRVAKDVSFKMPSGYEMGSWSDSAFNDFLGSIGSRQPGEAKPATRIKGLRTAAHA